jgi:threonine dehydrogenase-like Zn-dependent dehydrogenase
MRGAVLLGDQQVALREFLDPEPGFGEVVLRTRASGLCGSELHSLYQPPRKQREGSWSWGYIGGHEPVAGGRRVSQPSSKRRRKFLSPYGCLAASSSLSSTPQPGASETVK